MPVNGDYYIVTVKEAHLNWGTYRHSGSRDRIQGESYIQIPAQEARRFGFLKSTEYNCRSRDGLYNHPLLASGCSNGRSQYAKQFSSKGGLKRLGQWFSDVNIVVGDKIKVTWISPIEIEIEKL